MSFKRRPSMHTYLQKLKLVLENCCHVQHISQATYRECRCCKTCQCYKSNCGDWPAVCTQLWLSSASRLLLWNDVFKTARSRLGCIVYWAWTLIASGSFLDSAFTTPLAILENQKRFNAYPSRNRTMHNLWPKGTSSCHQTSLKSRI